MRLGLTGTAEREQVLNIPVQQSEMLEDLGMSDAAALCSVWVRTKARIIQSPPGQAAEGQRDRTGALRVEVSLTFPSPMENQERVMNPPAQNLQTLFFLLN